MASELISDREHYRNTWLDTARSTFESMKSAYHAMQLKFEYLTDYLILVYDELL